MLESVVYKIFHDSKLLYSFGVDFYDIHSVVFISLNHRH